MNILAFDLSKSCGWAFSVGWQQPTFGVKELPRGEHVTEGKVFHAFRQWLSEMCQFNNPDLLMFEAPMVGGEQMRTSAYLLIGLAALVEEYAESVGIDCAQEAVVTVRKHFCGSGRAKKDDVGFRCRQLGWNVTDHNAADALALLDFARASVLQRSTTIWRG
jgi:Holliday junction resolvasome RuvABC endonuclease subunit